MRTRVIAISRQVGAGGEEIAMTVAQQLGFRYIDYQIVQTAAQEANVSVETVSEAQHTPSLMTRILESLARSPSIPSGGWSDPGTLTASPLVTSTDYRRFIEDVIRDMADKGDCVIIGHGSPVILHDRTDVLRCLLTGTRQVRVKRVMQSMGVDEKMARRTVERSDAERTSYFHRFYDTEWLAPWTYDLCLNTDRLTTDQTVEQILYAAKHS